MQRTIPGHFWQEMLLKFCQKDISFVSFIKTIPKQDFTLFEGNIPSGLKKFGLKMNREISKFYIPAYVILKTNRKQGLKSGLLMHK